MRTNGAFKELYVPATANRSLIQVVLAIILFVPAILLGTLLKGLAQFNSNAREHHRIAAINNTAIERKDVKEKSSIEEILKELDEPYRRRIKTLVIEGNGVPIESISTGHKLAEIVERVVLINTPFTEALKHVISFQNFEPSPVSKVYFPPNDSKEGEILIHHYDLDYSETLKLSRATRDASGSITKSVPLTFKTKAELDDYEHKFDQEQEKIRTARHFSLHPEGFVSVETGKVRIAAYQVKTVDVALKAPLPRKHWLSSEKVRRVFVVQQLEVQ